MKKTHKLEFVFKSLDVFLLTRFYIPNLALKISVWGLGVTAKSGFHSSKNTIFVGILYIVYC